MITLALALALNAVVVPVDLGSEILRKAYTRASALDWTSDAGQREVWQLMGSAIAKVTAKWPVRTMGIDRVRTRLEGLCVQAGMTDETDPPKRSVLSLCFKVAPVMGSRDGVIVLAAIDRPVEKNQSDSSAILYLRAEHGMRVASVLRVSRNQDDLFGPALAWLTPNGILVGATYGWIGNGPSPSAYFFQRKHDRWVCASAAESLCESGEPPTFSRFHGIWLASVEGRTYPKNLSVAHVDANLAIRASFRFDGKRVSVNDARRPSAWAAFDDLAGAVKQNDAKGVARLCASNNLASRAVQILSRFDAMPSAASSDNRCSTDDHVFVLNDTGDRLHFAKIKGRWVLINITRTPSKL